MNLKEYRTGVRTGLPVGMGYFSVSFGFGAMAAAQGVKTVHAVLISLTNLTSAGQFAGLTLMVAGAVLWEVILTQLVINSRYALMSLALSQKMGRRIGLVPRLLIAFFNTDEIFALAMAREDALTVPFMLGLGTLPILGWTGGTVENYKEGAAIGGDKFGNREGLLPKKSGRQYYECDIDTKGKGSRGAKRIVFSNDGLIYYTDNHYESFTLLYGDE